LPPDVKSRELYLLFRAYAGYESSQLKMTMSNRNGTSKLSTPVGFVTFTSRQDADDVRQKLQGVKFDPDLPQTLRLELARSNTKVLT
jgi:RNA recognition motif-containing protein